jgi:hypothetical protein
MNATPIGLMALVASLSWTHWPGELQAPGKAPDDKEPPLVLALEADGKKIPIEVDRPFELEVGGGRTTCVLRMEPFREFRHAGLFFRYPRGFAFQVQSQPMFTCWTLSGGSTVLLVQRFKNNDAHEELLEAVATQMVKVYKPENVHQSPATVVLAKSPVKGTRLEVTLAQQRIEQTLVSIKNGRDSIILIFQETLGDAQKPAGQASEGARMVQESFRPAKEE